MMQELRRASSRFSDMITGGPATISLLVALTTAMVYQVRSDSDRDNHIASLEHNHDALARRIDLTQDALGKRVDDIDRTGTRTMNERFGHINDLVIGLTHRSDVQDEVTARRADLLAKRMTDLEGILNVARDQVTIVKERQEGVLRRLEQLEKTNPSTQVEVMRNDLARFAEQQSRIIQALDNTYNTLQEALRNDQITRKPTPGAGLNSSGPYPP